MTTSTHLLGESVEGGPGSVDQHVLLRMRRLHDRRQPVVALRALRVLVLLVVVVVIVVMPLAVTVRAYAQHITAIFMLDEHMTRAAKSAHQPVRGPSKEPEEQFYFTCAAKCAQCMRLAHHGGDRGGRHRRRGGRGGAGARRGGRDAGREGRHGGRGAGRGVRRGGRGAGHEVRREGRAGHDAGRAGRRAGRGVHRGDRADHGAADAALSESAGRRSRRWGCPTEGTKVFVSFVHQ